EDPRLSTPGLQFLAWIYFSKKDKTKEFLEKLKPQIHSISPSWSTAYGLFKKDQAQLVFSYLTSPVYHWVEEKNEDYTSASFEEPNPIQYEYVSAPKETTNKKIAHQFAEFMTSGIAQKILMEKNFMLPAKVQAIKGSVYEKLPTVSTVGMKDYENLNVEEL